MEQFREQIFQIDSGETFQALALEIFQKQAKLNPVYASYLKHRDIDPGSIQTLEEIPFLPISMFKNHQVVTGSWEPEVQFESSGTTGQIPSRHLIRSTALYERSFMEGFQRFYGTPSEFCILALLPSYLERGNSSLVYMMNHLIAQSKHPDSGFYLDDLNGLRAVIDQRNTDRHPTLLVGVAFALLDLAEKHSIPLAENIILMETGGMKGRRTEMVREELHALLKEAFQLPAIHSEYGMTELLSQAYSMGDQKFTSPPWMKILIRDGYDPERILPEGASGGINVIDLANLHSCAFIETGDLGRVHQDGSFEVLGRFDHQEIRGCNLMTV